MRKVLPCIGAATGLLAFLVLGCSGSSQEEYAATLPTTNGGGGSGPQSAVTSAVTGGNATSAGNGNTTGGINLTSTSQPDDPDGDACASADVPTSLRQVVLAFVFDVSASMGANSQPEFDKTLKWDPVVAATKAFFADADSKGISATMTFFPNDLAPLVSEQGGPGGNGGPSCEAMNYETPDVPQTGLPSEAFAMAIDAVTPPDDDSWRLGTPTLAALEGTYAAIDAMRAADPNSSYSVVLVTDGMPALCGGTADQVATVANAAAAVAAETPTYVIGVNNPTVDDTTTTTTSTTTTGGFPGNQFGDTLDDLNEVAIAGGTDAAFLINTDDPTYTATQFKAIIDQIREFSFSCSIPIPAPPGGEEFDKSKVNVDYTSQSLGEVPFDYDPACSATNGWHYDNEAAPTSIELCPAVCDAIKVQQDEGQLNVALGCQTRIK